MMEYIVTEIKGKNYIARIHKPILTAEENTRREAEVRKALVQFEIERRRNRI